MKVHIFLCTLIASFGVVYTYDEIPVPSRDPSHAIGTQAKSTKSSLRTRDINDGPFRLLPRGHSSSKAQPQRQSSNGGDKPSTENPKRPPMPTQPERSQFQPMTNALHRTDNFRRIIPQRPPPRNPDPGHIRQPSASQRASEDNVRTPRARREAGSRRASSSSEHDILTLPDVPQTPMPSRVGSFLNFNSQGEPIPRRRRNDELPRAASPSQRPLQGVRLLSEFRARLAQFDGPTSSSSSSISSERSRGSRSSAVEST